MTEHESMILCKCTEADRLLSFCISCGKIHAPDPSYVVMGLSAFFCAAQVLRWVL